MESDATPCVICGKPATTAEHKIKHSTMRAIHPFGAPDAEPPHFFSGGRLTTLRGPNAGPVKYPKSLCAHCNNVRTQPFDMAFEELTHHLLARRLQLQDLRTLDWQQVFGSGFARRRTQVALYLMKLLGCEIARHPLPVPEELRASMLAGNPGPGVKVYLSINEAVWRMDPSNSTLGHFGLRAMRRASTGRFTGFASGQTIGCFEVHIYFHHPNGGEANGSDILADDAVSTVGRYDRLADELRDFVDAVWMTPEYALRNAKTPDQKHLATEWQRVWKLQQQGVQLNEQDARFLAILEELKVPSRAKRISSGS